MTRPVAVAIVLAGAVLLLTGLWWGGALSGVAGSRATSPHEVLLEAVPVPDVPTLAGSSFNFSVVAKNPTGTAFSYSPKVTVTVYDQATNATVYTARIPLNGTFTLSPHHLATIYNGEVSLGPNSTGKSYWLAASGPSTGRVSVVGERILVSLLPSRASGQVSG